jgi:hypothetical protein
MVDAKYRYQVQVDGIRAANDRFGTPERALDVANKVIKVGRTSKKLKHVKVVDLANSRVLGESKDGSPIRRLKA